MTLEKESINIIKKAYANLTKIGLLWSGGKDSTVLLDLAIKAVGINAINIIHIDTGYKIEEIIKFRDKMFSRFPNSFIYQNDRYLDFTEPSIECCQQLKTKPLNELIVNGEYDGIFVGLRHDEEKTRGKESIFSKRNDDGWDIESDSLEIWGNYSYELSENEHFRINPILHWREQDIWNYIEANNLEYIDLYNSKNGERYRTIGCDRCTSKIKSNAKNCTEIAAELNGVLNHTSERATRLQDKYDNNSLEKLRLGGYM
ncbi:MAG: phosphoadenosine phosphosulfate reductase family protein [Anaeroplasmataceae bacterium]